MLLHDLDPFYQITLQPISDNIILYGWGYETRNGYLDEFENEFILEKLY